MFKGDAYNLPSKQAHIEAWERFYKSLTDPDLREQRKREAERKQQADDERKDVGL